MPTRTPGRGDGSRASRDGIALHGEARFGMNAKGTSKVENPFDDSDWDAETYGRSLFRPVAGTSYAIHFTARSGSSWVADVLKSTGVLGAPGECFNPAFVRTNARAYNTSNLDQYIAMLRRRRNVGGVYGHKVAWNHIKLVFGTPVLYMGHFHDSAFLWLRRRDIVAQAVSLSKLKQTRVGHTAQASADAIATADRSFAYNEAEIVLFLRQTLKEEIAMERVWRDFGVTPVRLYHEDIIRDGAQALVDRVASAVGVERPVLPESFLSGQAKLGTVKNEDFAERFRASGAVEAILEDRPPLA